MAASSLETDAALRAQWRKMVGEVLPSVAEDHPEWPVRLDHCFARIILDAICRRPWREAIAAPAWRNMDDEQLVAALALGERIRAGTEDLASLNARSLAMRGKGRRPT